ncbi:hypothetical protein VT84_25865 [Gemmata sp. SH-PL17]|uniref:MauE/DoxX family redox-associated membrane protein n=1 Tax=Gemmata sp. SH-PL17 TaxID=1630693 RepID=UPI00078E8D99|nr:MauE/DoxX family redox-associated membrane protein [Gemmata sp. SH-PL17]AMV27856.1 hypothetical protein VT84_25865 [Gemmata sp. SH-PL17]
MSDLIAKSSEGQSWLSRCAVCLVGLYFLAAAALKLFSDGSVSAGEMVYTPALRFLAVQAEIVLGTWLILGRWRLAAFMSACLLLAMFALLSLFSFLRGQSNCGCFGDLKVHPGITATVNLVALGLLALSRPQMRWKENRGAVVAVGTLAALTGGLAWVANGPVGNTLLARWQGQTVALQSSVVEAGEATEGTRRQFPVVVTNRSSRDVRIIGGNADCTCTTTRNLPVTVPASGEVTVEIDLKFRGTPGRFEHRFELFTDDKTHPKLRGVIVGHVADAP